MGLCKLESFGRRITFARVLMSPVSGFNKKKKKRNGFGAKAINVHSL